MQGLVNLSDQLALIMAVTLPAFCYLAAIGSFLFAAWGFWQQAQPHNPFRGKPWIPVLSLVLAGFFATFDKLLTRANRSAGSDVTVGLGSDLTSYTSPANASSLMGNSPADAVNNTVAVFSLFFACFGAWCAFAALSSWRLSMIGANKRTWQGCGVQFALGVCLINIQTITAWVVSQFS
jgi:hypothetical protein